MGGAPEPEVIGEERLELGGDEAHLGRELHALLPHEAEIGGALRVGEDDGFAAEEAVLGAAEREDVHAGGDGECAEREVE